MFFIFGISNGEKKLDFVQSMICSRCGSFGRLEVYMTYMYFSLFFIPIFKWGRKYYAKSSCCGAQYTIREDVGRRILKKEQVNLTEQDLEPINNRANGQMNGQMNGQAAKRCSNCGYVSDPDFDYCPKCGSRLN